MSEAAEISVVLTNKKGLHARAAAKFVKTVGGFDAKVMVAKVAGAGVTSGAEHEETSGGSILGLMMLGAECGSTLRLRASGSQAYAALKELQKLLQDRFGEE
jgi:phosphotransferase system HPr (HPr) family protein